MIYTRFGGEVKKFLRVSGTHLLEASVYWDDEDKTTDIHVNIIDLKATNGVQEVYDKIEEDLGITADEIFGIGKE